MKVAVVHNTPAPGRADSEDVLQEVGLVTEALSQMDIDFNVISVGGNHNVYSLTESTFALMLSLRKYSPDLIFNLIEGFMDNPVYQHYFALLFEMLEYPFTGSRHEAVLTTTDKKLSKMIMKAFNIPTVAYQEYRGRKIEVTLPWPVLVKPSLEDSSVGIDDASVYYEEDTLMSSLPDFYRKFSGQPLLIERYIEGREFNISLLERDDGGVTVLPPAEMIFEEWPSGKPKIVGYRAKWNSDSFEYSHTVRRFLKNDPVTEELSQIALRCWKVFNLSGYARVDLRIDEAGEIFVMEVNTNPCIAPDSGFIAAAAEAGYGKNDVVRAIIASAMSGCIARKKIQPDQKAEKRG